ncbi:uncharacterized protein Hqrw_2814 [Haloquadratum walsbyi C23]|uniref:Uncharacterized protein n=1 Tax=Haloquadratum walsbyi (strain DSM 16854 / JCM 12705 / C23) TaxID=768065 RepID=G0LJ62_HALWC|nr:uncharacterized protein Hqrw_2814 [Haloquadratum walsbyi C23]
MCCFVGYLDSSNPKIYFYTYCYITYILMLSFSSDLNRSFEALDGVTHTENIVKFDITAYSRFIEIVAGIDVTDNLCKKEYYRIRNRVEAFIHDAKRYQIWKPALLDAYPDVDLLAEITALTRALRQYEQQRLTH